MSLVIVVVFLSIMLFLADLLLLQAQKNAEAEREAIFLEKAYYKQLELKHAVMNTLGVEAGKTIGREEAVKKASERLAELEAYAEKNSGEWRIDLWCGAIEASELELLPAKMLEKNETLKCAKCWDFEELALQIDPAKRKASQMRKCASFIDAKVLERKIGVSMGGLELTADVQVEAARWSGRRGIGISMLNEQEEYAAVAFIPEGTWKEYS